MADPVVVDAHTKEQGRLLRAFHFGQDRPKDEWSSTGPRSLSPFVPCASARIAAVFSATRLTHEDVLWDLGCGDGRVLHQAAVQHGCRCVGLEIDRACVDEAKQRAAEQRLEDVRTDHFVYAHFYGLCVHKLSHFFGKEEKRRREEKQ